MVKRGKKSKGKGAGDNSLDAVFGEKKPQWHTNASMLVDAEEETIDIKPKTAKSQAGSVKDMDCTEGVPRVGRATSHVPGLGVITHSCKRGDHTTKQKKRKVKKLVKAMARADRVGVRINATDKKRQDKVALKNVLSTDIPLLIRKPL